MSLLVTLGLYSGDLDKGLRLLRYIARLGGVKRHHLVIGASYQLDLAPHVQVAKEAFSSVEVAPFSRTVQGWPAGPNINFTQMVAYLKGRGPFLWLEADMAPLRPEWVDVMEAEYRESGARFSGNVHESRMPDGQGGYRVDGDHMNGGGIYPANVEFYLPTLTHVMGQPLPWDILCQWETRYEVDGQGGYRVDPYTGQRVEHRHKTERTCLSWQSRNYRMEDGRLVFEQDKQMAWREEIDWDRHVLHHGAKDDSLLAILEARLDRPPQPPAPPTETANAIILPADGTGDIRCAWCDGPIAGKNWRYVKSSKYKDPTEALGQGPDGPAMTVCSGECETALVLKFPPTDNGYVDLNDSAHIPVDPGVTEATREVRESLAPPPPERVTPAPLDLAAQDTSDPLPPGGTPPADAPPPAPVSKRKEKAIQKASWPPAPKRGERPAGATDEEWVAAMPMDFKAAVRKARKDNFPPYPASMGHYSLTPKLMSIIVKEAA